MLEYFNLATNEAMEEVLDMMSYTIEETFKQCYIKSVKVNCSTIIIKEKTDAGRHFLPEVTAK